MSTRVEIAEHMSVIETEMEQLAQRARNANTQRYRDYLEKKFSKLFSEHRRLHNAVLYQTITGPSCEEITQRQCPDGKWIDGVFDRPIRTTGEMYGPNSPGWR